MNQTRTAAAAQELAHADARRTRAGRIAQAQAATARPLIVEVADLLGRQGIRVKVTPNQHGGLDFTRTFGRGGFGVRLSDDDGQIGVDVLANYGPTGTRATFTNMPAGVIVATVAAYLA